MAELPGKESKTWIAGTSPVMTKNGGRADRIGATDIACSFGLPIASS